MREIYKKDYKRTVAYLHKQLNLYEETILHENRIYRYKEELERDGFFCKRMELANFLFVVRRRKHGAEESVVEIIDRDVRCRNLFKGGI